MVNLRKKKEALKTVWWVATYTVHNYVADIFSRVVLNWIKIEKWLVGWEAGKVVHALAMATFIIKVMCKSNFSISKQGDVQQCNKNLLLHGFELLHTLHSVNVAGSKPRRSSCVLGMTRGEEKEVVLRVHRDQCGWARVSQTSFTAAGGVPAMLTRSFHLVLLKQKRCKRTDESGVFFLF